MALPFNALIPKKIPHMGDFFKPARLLNLTHKSAAKLVGGCWFKGRFNMWLLPAFLFIYRLSGVFKDAA
jgi:hypothetical protein